MERENIVVSPEFFRFISLLKYTSKFQPSNRLQMKPFIWHSLNCQNVSLHKKTCSLLIFSKQTYLLQHSWDMQTDALELKGKPNVSERFPLMSSFEGKFTHFTYR